MPTLRCSVVAIAVCVSTVSATAQTIPVRSLSTPVATDSGMFLGAVTVRPLSNGTAIVNDFFRLRLFVFDAQFKAQLVADTSGTTPNRYPTTSSQIVPYLGDSTLLSDRTARAWIVVGPDGKFGRVMAPPITSDFNVMASSQGGSSTDPNGRLVYRVTRRAPPRPAGAPAPPRPDSGKMDVQVSRDSAVIVRADFDTRTVDSVALVAQPIRKMVTVNMGSMGGMGAGAANPLPSADDWVMLSDGTIAVVRVGDYHIDFVKMDGTRVSAPKMAFDWKRVTDDDKKRMLDSVKARYDSARAKLEEEMARQPRRPPGGISMTSYGDGVSIATGEDGKSQFLPFVAVEPSEMPDYYPPIRAGFMKADQDGNVWILPTTSTLAANGLVYDVVNGKGEVVERVKLPPNRRLMAIGKGGVVYMSNVERGFRLERATIIR